MNDDFLSEWQRLKQERQSLLGEAEQLKRRLASLAQEPEMKTLIQEKRDLKEEASRLARDVQSFKDALTYDAQSHSMKIARRKEALTNPRVRQQLDDLLRGRHERLNSLVALNAPEHIIKNEMRMIFEIEGSIEEVAELYKEMIAETKKLRDERQAALDATLARIQAMEDHYRRAQRCLEETIAKTEQKIREARANQIEWATQDRDHLDWALKQEPLSRDDFARRYKSRFPNDDLADLFPRALTPAQEGCAKRLRMYPEPPPPPSATEVTPAPLPAWRFWVTFREADEGQELPARKKHFLERLRTALDKASYPELSVDKVYDQIMDVAQMTTAQRQQIKKIREEEEMRGWKIVRAGRGHRLFLLVDEEKRHIRFLPRRRKASYSDH